MLAEEIPNFLRADQGLLRDVANGRFDTLDANMFAELKGETLVIVGHVVDLNGEATFEVRGDQPTYVPLWSVQEAAERIGFNFIPLGCETAETAAIGTGSKITDLDGLSAFKRAALREGVTTYQDLLADLSGPNLQLVIDIGQASGLNVVPLEVRDANGTSYRPPPSLNNTSTAPPQTPITLLNMSVANSGWLKLTCPLSPDLVKRSINLTNMVGKLSRIWQLVIAGWIALFVLAFANEFAAKAERLGTSAAKKFPWVASFLAVTHAPVRATYYVVDAGGMVLALGFYCAAFGWLTIEMNPTMWDFWSSSDVHKGLGSVLFVLASIVIVDQLRFNPVGKLWSIFVRLCGGAFVVLGIFGGGDIAPVFFGGLAALVAVGVPLFAYRYANLLNCRLAGYVAVLFIPILLVPVSLGWIWGAAARDCLLIEPQPIRDTDLPPILWTPD